MLHVQQELGKLKVWILKDPHVLVDMIVVSAEASNTTCHYSLGRRFLQFPLSISIRLQAHLIRLSQVSGELLD